MSVELIDRSLAKLYGMAPPAQNCTSELINSMEILEKHTPATLPVEYIDVKYLKRELQDDSVHMQMKCEGLQFPFQATPVFTVPIKNAKILFDEGTTSKKIVEVSIDTSCVYDYTFSPGDTVGILVSNSETDVDRVLCALRSSESIDDLCEVFVKPKTAKKNAKVPQYVPKQATARTILRDCLDLRSVPKKLFLRSLAEYTSDEREKEILISISSKEGSKLYNELILGKTRTFLEVLNLCPSCSPPLSLLIEHLPRLNPRPYSIANSPLSKTGLVTIIFSILPEKPGVATSYLVQMAEKFLEHAEGIPKIDLYFRKSNKFSFQEDDVTVDNILIGVGCGVSPFLGFLEHKECLMKKNKMVLGSTWLFVGSSTQKSAVYREQLLEYRRRNVLQKLFESFSRDPECNSFKYLQDQLKANAAEFVDRFLTKNTILYICADGTKISKSIENCIKECLVQSLECSEEEAERLIAESRLNGEYREDVWV